MCPRIAARRLLKNANQCHLRASGISGRAVHNGEAFRAGLYVTDWQKNPFSVLLAKWTRRHEYLGEGGLVAFPLSKSFAAEKGCETAGFIGGGNPPISRA